MAECFAHRRHGTELADNAKCVFLMTAWQPRMTCERAGIGVAQRTYARPLVQHQMPAPLYSTPLRYVRQTHRLHCLHKNSVKSLVPDVCASVYSRAFHCGALHYSLSSGQGGHCGVLPQFNPPEITRTPTSKIHHGCQQTSCTCPSPNGEISYHIRSWASSRP